MIVQPWPNVQCQAHCPKGVWNDSHPNLEIKEALAFYRFQQLGMQPNCFPKTYKREGGGWVCYYQCLNNLMTNLRMLSYHKWRVD